MSEARRLRELYSGRSMGGAGKEGGGGGGGGVGGSEGGKGDGGDETKWDAWRAARLIFYGGTMFAPLAHNWLNLLQRVQLSTKFRSEYHTNAFHVSSISCSLFHPFPF